MWVAANCYARKRVRVITSILAIGLLADERLLALALLRVCAKFELREESRELKQDSSMIWNGLSCEGCEFVASPCQLTM